MPSGYFPSPALVNTRFAGAFQCARAHFAYCLADRRLNVPERPGASSAPAWNHSSASYAPIVSSCNAFKTLLWLLMPPCMASHDYFGLAGPEPDGVRHEADGDTHGCLDLDLQFKSLLNAGNISSEGGNLVFEMVCKFKVSQADAKTACPSTFHNQVQIPPVGSHVRLVGTYVQDTNHAQWMEIHPVTSITVIP